jgi:hypothetical protein
MTHLKKSVASISKRKCSDLQGNLRMSTINLNLPPSRADAKSELVSTSSLLPCSHCMVWGLSNFYCKVEELLVTDGLKTKEAQLEVTL